MDIEFIVQDTFALTRPQWKLASNLEEAGRAFQLAVAQDHKSSGLNKAVEVEEPEVDESSDDDGEAGLPEPEDSTEEEDADVSTLFIFIAVHANVSLGGNEWRWSSFRTGQ
jgi:regulator of nonsense transcripts 2